MNDYHFPENLNWSDKTIVLFEQEESSAILLKEILAPTKVNISHVTEKARMNDVEAHKVDVIIVGIGVDEMVNGLPFTKEVRMRYPGVPMIAHTVCYMNEKELQKCFDAGCETILGKPFDFEDLAELLIFFLGES
jgi:CheY-like chemotaxis protein